MHDGDRVRIVKHVTLHGIDLCGRTGRIVDCGTRYATVEIDTVAWLVRVPIKVMEIVPAANVARIDELP